MQLSTIANIQSQLTMALGTDKSVQSVALGVALAYVCPVPATAVRGAGVDTYFINHHFSNIDAMLSQLNEVFLIEIQTVHDVARTIWNMRYRSVHISTEDIADLATKTNPIRDYLSGFQLDDARLQQVLATGVSLANLFNLNNLLKTDDTTRG